MKNVSILKVLAVFAVICGICVISNPQKSFAVCKKVGDVAPDFELEEINSGEMIKLSDYKGKLVILTFWATWCPRCWEELDYIKARFEKDDKVKVLLVNMETQSLAPAHVKRIKETAKEHDIKFPMLLDKRLVVWDSYCVNSLPSTVIVDPDGNIAFVEANFYFASRDNIDEIIQKYTKEK